jgi:hypothetical protein
VGQSNILIRKTEMKFKTGDRVKFLDSVNPDGNELGTITSYVGNIIDGEVETYSVSWDDGFDDGDGNVFSDWELEKI